MNREVKLKELQLLDAARRKFLHFQKQQRESELRRLDDEVQKKALLRDQETESAMEEAEIRNLELQLQKKMFEQELFREFATTSHHLRTEQDMHRKQAELEERIQERLRDAERERQMEIRKSLQDGLAKSSQQNIEAWASNEYESRRRLEDLERETKSLQLAKRNAENRSLEKEVQDLMTKVQERKDTETEYANLELGDQKEYAAESDQRRLRLMEEEGYAAHHHGKSLTQDALSNINNSSRLGNTTLNSTRPSELYQTLQTTASSASVSLERSGRAFDDKEIALLNEVRNLRQRLALENRNKRPPPVLCE